VTERLSGRELAPIEVYSDGFTHWLFDGFHRVAAAKTVGITEIEATITPGTYADLQSRWQEALAMIRADLRR
jgi:ParB-like chromosome segregation protein Spo0J